MMVDTARPPRLPASRSADAPGSSVILTCTVAFTLLLRFVLADRQSYWLDELYSVYAYTVQPDGFVEAIRALADTSIHPPLYQSLLYGWVALFGDAEVATRSLSSILIALATVALHRLVRRQFDPRTADVVAVMFAVSSVAMYYGLETRSYAQTLLLTVLSMLALDHVLRPAPTPRARRWRRWAPTVGFTLANVALLMTHYYNAFVWGAQALLVAAVVLRQDTGAVAWRRLGRLTAIYVAQLALFLALWGAQLWASFRDDSGNYDTAVPDAGPLDIAASVADEIFALGPLGRLVAPALALASIAGIIAGGRRIARTRARRQDDVARDVDRIARRDTADGVGFGLLQAGWMAIGPAIVAYLAFLVVGAERVSPRYFIALAPPMLILVAWLGLRLLDRVREVIVRPADTTDDGASATDRNTDTEAAAGTGIRRRGPVGGSVLVPLVFALVLTVPGGYLALTEPKADWRGASEQITAIATSNPEQTITVWETAFRATPMLDYYLARHGDLRVDGLIRRLESTRGGPFAFEDEDERDRIREHDWLLVPFIHHRTTDMAYAVETLDATFTRELSILDDEGRGLIIYDTAPPPSR